MNDLKILIGNIIKNVRTNDTYRVIYIGNGYIGLCKINTNKIEIDYPTAKGLGLNIRNNLFEIITDEPDIFDESIIPVAYKPIYNERKELVKAVTSEYGPSFMGLIGKKKKPIIISFIQNFISNFRLSA